VTDLHECISYSFCQYILISMRNEFLHKHVTVITFAYWIKNQTQYYRTLTLHYTNFHLMVPAVQHHFQLYQQRSPLYSFYTCDHLVRIASDNEEKMFHHYLLRWITCYFPYSIDMLIFHTYFNQKPFHT
jgi:hypothetical protein